MSQFANVICGVQLITSKCAVFCLFFFSFGSGHVATKPMRLKTLERGQQLEIYWPKSGRENE
ncbi:hypothetical protein A7M48_18660 [Acinetobacter baumannii]|nr:hypothetical protein A7M48_18660 [Acinetobacter baumannii]